MLLTRRQVLRSLHERTRSIRGKADSLSIGELASGAGITVRALHHYDRIGLVRPSERTLADHRRYTASDVARLYRVLALRHLGVGLDRIEELIGSPSHRELLTTVQQQLDHVEGQRDELGRLRDRLAGLAAALQRRPETMA